MLLNSCKIVLSQQTSHFHISTALNNAHRAAYGKIGREKYLRVYRVTLMQPDGSTISVRYCEPRYFVQLPVDVSMLSDHDRRMRVASRKKQIVLPQEETFEEDFDFSKYTHSASR